MSVEVRPKPTMRQMPWKGARKAYKKPKIMAKSAAKQSFVAGCFASMPPPPSQPADRVHGHHASEEAR